MLSPCLPTTKQLRSSPASVLVEPFPDSVDNREAMPTASRHIHSPLGEQRGAAGGAASSPLTADSLLLFYCQGFHRDSGNEDLC